MPDVGSGDWVHVKNPFVYWSQTEKIVRLRVEILNAKDLKIDFEKFKVTFSTNGQGAHGESEYSFELPLAHSVDPEECMYRVLGREVDIVLQKEEQGWWTKVTTTNKKPAWLKVDFDRWRSPDDEDEIPPDVFNDYPRVKDQLELDEKGYRAENIRVIYLFLYNLFQFIGYLFILLVMSVRFLHDGKDTFRETYKYVGGTMKYCQMLQILEIIHPLLGFTKTGVLMAFIQVMGRNLILFALINSEPRIQTHPAVFCLFFVWSLAEVVRYPFYMVQISKKEIRLLTWLRYSAWIILYPLGIACECVIIFNCISYFTETKRYSVSLPNSWNFSFSLTSIMRGYLLIGVIPVSTALLKGMWMARKKALKKGSVTKCD